MGGGTHSFMDESFSRNSYSLVEESGELSCAITSFLRIHHIWPSWVIGIGSKYLNGNNIRVLRFWNTDITNDIDNVIEKIIESTK